MERVEKLATCVAPTARSSRGGFCWRGRFPLVRRVSVGAATPVRTAAFCRSDASRELFGRTRTPPDPARPVPVRTAAFCRSDASREPFGRARTQPDPARPVPVRTTAFCRSDASRELFGRARTPPDPAQPVPVRTVAFCRSDASRELFGPTSPMSAEGRMVEPFSSAVGRAAHAAASPRAREGVRIRR